MKKASNVVLLGDDVFLIHKVVIPAAGLGTRLLPATKETPKEMLPIFALDKKGEVCIKPLLQVIFESFYDIGLREFCFIVGRGKESISDHFTSDSSFLRELKETGKNELVEELVSFYEKANISSLVFISQPEPKGFGDAVLKAEPYVKEPFLVQAGDTIILSKKSQHLKKLVKVHEETKSAATILVGEVEDPRPFGIIKGKEVDAGIYDVEMVVEKPEKPPSNLAISAVYVFSPAIFSALKSIPKSPGKELQLTDGIQKLIDSGLKVTAVKLDKDEFWLDVGSPQTYWKALCQAHRFYEEGD